ncbi:hypothetical protein NKG99_20450 [Mesorhizobium sp. M1409]|uniref:hypothetical protein n=1 Tax=Mesorhizobium sp. M1409 TaxID=2957100 RepID=UPI00333B4AB4
MGPRDQPTRFGVPVNYETGEPLTDRQMHHLEAIKVAADVLYAAMHEAEGSGPPGEHQDHVFQSRRMAIAATHVETALMFARKAALEAK